jgi:AcrR family transcriptional regulator
MPPLDRRQRRTRKMLADALVELIHTKGYEAISITDITDTADLNRATFYLHYGSKEELLVDLLEARFDELVTQMETQIPTIPVWVTPQSEQLIYEHIAEHIPLYRILLGQNAIGYVIKRVIDYIAGVVERQIGEILPEGHQLPIPLTLASRHVAGSMYAQIVWWIENDMPYSAEYMARVTHTLCLRGTLELWQELMPLQVMSLAELGAGVGQQESKRVRE